MPAKARTFSPIACQRPPEFRRLWGTAGGTDGAGLDPALAGV